MKIVVVTSEAAPFVKTGGLADVTGALERGLRKRGVDASLILPLYKCIRENFSPVRTSKKVILRMGQKVISASVWLSEKSSSPYAYFIECDELYGREELYGTSEGDYPDNALRFSFFSRAVPELCSALKISPDVIHCNDWQTGLLPLYLKAHHSENRIFRNTTVLFTIHNLGYQGLFPVSDLEQTGIGWEYYKPEGLEFYGKVNFMKAGLIYSDLLSTVSETYAREITEKEQGFGLDGVLNKRKAELFGITNGIDYDEWDPSRDTMIPARYGPEDRSGKKQCRKRLLAETGLRDSTLPVFGIVSRLSSQKGLDLVAGSMEDLLSMGVNLVMIGKGDEHYQNQFTDFSEKYKGRVYVRIGFEEQFSHLVYSGSDFFLMPSLYEPCGLGQLISLRYGTIPVARGTGGLVDTIVDYDQITSTGTGFLFSDYTVDGLLGAVKRAMCVFADRDRMHRMIADAMKADFSYERAVAKYLDLYRFAADKAVAR